MIKWNWRKMKNPNLKTLCKGERSNEMHFQFSINQHWILWDQIEVNADPGKPKDRTGNILRAKRKDGAWKLSWRKQWYKSYFKFSNFVEVKEMNILIGNKLTTITGNIGNPLVAGTKRTMILSGNGVTKWQPYPGVGGSPYVSRSGRSGFGGKSRNRK